MPRKPLPATIPLRYRSDALHIFRTAVHSGEVLLGSIERLTPHGAFIRLGLTVGFVHVSEVSNALANRTRSDLAKARLRRGQHVRVTVLHVSANGKEIVLSMRRVPTVS
jgi:predicted RNA-binding protein with RPS1 domain